MTYNIGQYTIDNKDNRGWFIGSFMKNEANRTSVVEIKYTELPTGPTNHGLKTSTTYECSIFISGKSRAIIDGVEHIIGAGDYVAIQPNTPNNLVVEILEPVKIITIKAPCDPSAKKIIEDGVKS